NSKGVIGLQFNKDITSPRWNRDPEVLEYQDLLKKYASDVDPSNSTGASGYIVAQLMAHVLREAGNELTRDNVRRLASNLKNPRIAMLLPGVKLENSPSDLFATASLQPVRFNGTDLDPIGPALSTK
ncbi:MAG: hypothetical protein KGM91_26115, partial [Burkholderiales bacterium]|nr:hypothetical protein [Burkholderiales bacterium]